MFFKLKTISWVFCLVAGIFIGSTALAIEPYFEKDQTVGLNIPEIVAKVNGVELDSKFVKFEFNKIMKTLKTDMPRAQRVEVVRDIIDKEIVRELLYQKGKELNKTVDSKKVDEEFKKLESAYASRDAFLDALKEREINETVLRNSIRIDIMAHELLQDQIAGKIHLTDADVKKYYDENKESFFRPEAFHARHIFMFHFPPDLAKSVAPKELEEKKKELSEEARNRMIKVRQEVIRGGDFAELAKKYSEDAGSSQNGGDLDYIYKGVFPEEFDAAISKLKPGQVSEVVETPFGYHIIKVLETKPSEYAPFKEVEPGIQKYLFAQEAKSIISEYLADVKKNAKVEIYY